MMPVIGGARVLVVKPVNCTRPRGYVLVRSAKALATADCAGAGAAGLKVWIPTRKMLSGSTGVNTSVRVNDWLVAVGCAASKTRQVIVTVPADKPVGIMK